MRAHLFRISRAEAPNCKACNAATESVHHFVMMCPAYASERRKMVHEGGRGTLVLVKLMKEEKMIAHLFRYVARTGRFRDTAGDLDEVG